jgi:hypothetical protein
MCEPPPARRETPVAGDVADRRGRPLAKRAAGGRALPERSRPGQSPRQRCQLHRLVGVQQLAAERGGGQGGGTPRAEPDGATIPSLPQEDHRRGRGCTGTAPARRWCVPTPSACGASIGDGPAAQRLAVSCAAGRRRERAGCGHNGV